MTKIGIILGSTRPGRRGAAVARWVLENAATRSNADYELVDLADVPLPNLDERLSPTLGLYEHEHTRAWAATVARFDGYVFVTPEYNHSIPGVLKNALDFVYGEWNDKAAGIVSYGGGDPGGARGAEQLRLILGELQIADVSGQVALSFRTDFTDAKEFTPASWQAHDLSKMLDQVESWSRALKPVRAVPAM
jgi:NAD(P)H-dependent FMN reductase